MDNKQIAREMVDINDRLQRIESILKDNGLARLQTSKCADYLVPGPTSIQYLCDLLDALIAYLGVNVNVEPPTPRKLVIRKK